MLDASNFGERPEPLQGRYQRVAIRVASLAAAPKRYKTNIGEQVFCPRQPHQLRSGRANLNNFLSGNSGHKVRPRTAGQTGVFDGQEVSTTHTSYAHARF